ncbi:recombinase [Chitinophaga lutea]|uniref:Recombinase n=1 Tax=Chitinophaga lutea TaxID=2488634 RepID=A0A3N4Q182_9BACT|nr:recombinase RecT [Chitinophaga lutea]RPE05514.1 recombinase [Chitinophaga lutea]
MSNVNAPAAPVKSKIEVLKDIMNAPSVQEQFQNALRENSGVFVASVIDLFNSDTYLQNCEPKQVVMECLKAATLKLPINKNLGFAYVVPYKSNGKQIPQFQIGYKGYIQLAMRTGQYRIINADKVYEGEYRTKNKLTGEFDLSGTATSETVVGYFAHIEMLNGFAKTLYMTKEKVAAHAKKYSKSFGKETSPWHTEFDAMALKTVLRNLLSHYGYLSVEMMGAMNADIESDQVGSEVSQTINDKANKQEMTFDDAEVVDDDEKEQNPI